MVGRLAELTVLHIAVDAGVVEEEFPSGTDAFVLLLGESGVRAVAHFLVRGECEGIITYSTEFQGGALCTVGDVALRDTST